MVAAAPIATYKCLSSTGLPCQSGSGQCSCNAVQVKETRDRQHDVPEGARAHELHGDRRDVDGEHARRARRIPIDVAVVLDTTASMNSGVREQRVGHLERAATKLDCAKEGVRALLTLAQPVQSRPSRAAARSRTETSRSRSTRFLCSRSRGSPARPRFTHDIDEHATATRASSSAARATSTATPSWYTPTTGTMNEVERITVTRRAANFTLSYRAAQERRSSTLAGSAGARNASRRRLTSLSNLEHHPRRHTSPATSAGTAPSTRSRSSARSAARTSTARASPHVDRLPAAIGHSFAP